MRFLSVREVCEKIGLGRNYDTHSGMLETIPNFPSAIVFDEGCVPAEPPAEVHYVFDEEEIEWWMQLQKDKRNAHIDARKAFFTRIKAESTRIKAESAN
jgi:predicted DNA-binding transcriptional regulator AlpA